MPSPRSTAGRHSSRPSGLQPARAGLRCPLLTSAGRSGRIPPPSVRRPGHLADLPGSAVLPSVHRRRMDQAQPSCGWRAVRWRARSPRLYHTSYPVRVPRPAPAFHASCRPHLTVTPWRFPGPSAPRTPGRETCTPKHDRMHGTHAWHEPRAPPRRLQALVRRGDVPPSCEVDSLEYGCLSRCDWPPPLAPPRTVRLCHRRLAGGGYRQLRQFHDIVHIGMGGE